MIEIIRYISILICGLFTLLSLIGSKNPLVIIFVSLLLIVWLFLSPKGKFIQGLILPTFILPLILGFFYGNPIFIQLILFIVIISAWEIDSLYIDSKGLIEKKDEWTLLKPLLIREVLSLTLIFTSWFVSTKIKFNMSFWPLSVLVILLIVILRKIFQLRKEDTQ